MPRHALILGASLGMMILLAGGFCSAALGWVSAGLIVHALACGRSGIFPFFIAGCLANIIGLFWIWPATEYISRLSALYVSLFFVLFVGTHALQFVICVLLYRGLPARLDRFALRAAIAWTAAECIPFRVFPWRLGHSQLALPALIQPAEVGGTCC